MVVLLNFVSQLDSFGNPEKIDATVYSVSILCSEPTCMQVRYLKPADQSQTDYCKPHARKHRLASRARRARENRKKSI